MSLRAEWVRGADSIFDPEPTRELIGTPFQEVGWLRPWWETFGSGTPLALRIWEGQDLIAQWAMVISNGPCRVLRPMGIRGSDYLPPSIRPVSNPWPTILDALGDLKGVDIVSLGRLREDQIPSPIATKERCLLLALPDNFDDYAKGLSKSLKSDLKKAESLQITKTSEDLEPLFSLHAKRWKKRHLPGAFGQKTQAFHRKVHINRSIYYAWHQGQAIGALYALHSRLAEGGCPRNNAAGGVTYFYQSGFDPDFARLSPGSALIAHAIKDAIEHGDQFFDFLRGDEAYKRRWKPTEELASGGLRIARSPLGRLLLPGFTLTDAVERNARATFEGKSLAAGARSLWRGPDNRRN